MTSTDLRSGARATVFNPIIAAHRGGLPPRRPRLVVIRADALGWMAVVLLAAWLLG